MYSLLCKPQSLCAVTLSYLPCHNNLKCDIVNDTKCSCCEPFAHFSGIWCSPPLFHAQWKVKILNTFKKGIYKIVTSRVFFYFVSLPL